jgi:ribosomal protein S18 acetylase RimI-like enzyme
MLLQRGLATDDRPAIAALLRRVAVLSDDECTTALEFVDAHLASPDASECRFILTFEAPLPGVGGGDRGRLAGYLCYGRTARTKSTYDVYWLVCAPEFSGALVAQELIVALEEAIQGDGGGLVRVDLCSRGGDDTPCLYDGAGFARVAVIPDFYAPGVDLVVFVKRVGGADTRPLSVAELDEQAVYDFAFGYRDYAAERDFLLACARRFGSRDVRHVIAWASGPARHLAAFAELGIAGVGVDASEAMIGYCQRVVCPRDSASSAKIAFVKADLDDTLAVGPTDLSFVALSSIHKLTTPERLEKHLRSAAMLLSPGGIHVIEATHPGDLLPTGVNHTQWTEVRGNLVVDTRFSMHVDRLTPERVVPVTLDVFCSSRRGTAGQAGRFSLRLEDLWFIPDLGTWRAIISRIPELELAATLGDFNIVVPFEHSAAWRLLLVLRKR